MFWKNSKTLTATEIESILAARCNNPWDFGPGDYVELFETNQTRNYHFTSTPFIHKHGVFIHQETKREQCPDATSMVSVGDMFSSTSVGAFKVTGYNRTAIEKLKSLDGSERKRILRNHFAPARAKDRRWTYDAVKNYFELLLSGDLQATSKEPMRQVGIQSLTKEIVDLYKQRITHPLGFREGHYLEIAGVRRELYLSRSQIVRKDGSIFKAVGGEIGLNMVNGGIRSVCSFFDSCLLATIPIDPEDPVVKKLMELSNEELKEFIPSIQSVYVELPKYLNSEIRSMVQGVSTQM